MNLLFPHMTQFEESQRDLERDFRLRQQIGAARAARRCQADISLCGPHGAPAPLAAATKRVLLSSRTASYEAGRGCFSGRG